MHKNRIKLSILLFSIFSVFNLTGSRSDEQGKILYVQPIVQESQVWCWAASAQMILDYHYENVTQRQQAVHYLKAQEYQVIRREYLQHLQQDSFVRQAQEESEVRGLPPVMPDFSRYGFRSNWGGALSWDNLVSEINNNRPFGFSWIFDSGSGEIPESENEPGGGHYMVVIGYQIEDGKKYVWIIDPSGLDGIATPERIPYEEYRKDAEHGYKHYIDQYEIMK